MSLKELKGYSVPFSPNGTAQIVGNLPWNFGVDIFAVNFKTDIEEIRKLLPEPLELSKQEPDGAYVWFGDWQGIWSGAENMLEVNPERVQYRECLLGVRCSYKGVEGHRVVYIWVDKDFSMLRGWFMGFPKKFGHVHIGSGNRHLHDLNPALREVGVGRGQRYTSWVETHGNRVATATLELQRKITPTELPQPFGTDLFHTIHFPSADVDNKKPLVHQLIQTVSANHKFGEIWECKGSAVYAEDAFEEHTAIRPREITSAYLIPVGFSILGTKLIHTY